MIAGVGVDIMEVERIRSAITRLGDAFVQRIYLPDEADYCRKGAHPYQRFATRFAAKEAVLKALGVGWQKGTSFTDVVVSNDELGAPSVSLEGKSLEIAERNDIHTIHLSLSHDHNYAVAQAVAES
ncbi:MAG: holo-ACP synthase [Candidatus Brocadiia bacterium]